MGFDKLIKAASDWMWEGVRQGDWGKVILGAALIIFAIVGGLYAIKVCGSAFDAGARSVDISEAELLEAARRGDKRAVLAKLNEGVDINKQDKDGLTALMCACSAGKAHDEVVQLLIDRGANLNLRDKGGGTALMHAALEGHVSLGKILMRNGADVHAKTAEGITAMKLALDKGHAQMVDLLREASVTNMKETSDDKSVA